MATLTFNTKESMDSLLVMIEHGIIVIKSKIDRKLIYEARIKAHEDERSKLSFFAKLRNDWNYDESPAAKHARVNHLAIYEIGHTHIPNLHHLENLRKLLNTNPGVITMSDSDMNLILMTNADFEKQFKDNVEDSNNALNS